MANEGQQKTIIVGAGPVGALAALYAAKRGDDVEVYELRGGRFASYETCLIQFQKGRVDMICY
jgi:phytoene dehydrogenase-like protein